MFRAIFCHHQERETEIFTAYGNLLLWWARCRLPTPCPPQQQVTICCKNLSLTLLMMAKDCPKHVELILQINKLLSHLVDSSSITLPKFYLFCIHQRSKLHQSTPRRFFPQASVTILHSHRLIFLYPSLITHYVYKYFL